MLVFASFTRPVHAQITIPIPVGPEQIDTTTVEPFRIRPPVSPLGAMFRSLLLPGWGQSRLERSITGAVFVFWEGVTLTMTLKSKHQLSFLRRADAARPEGERDRELLDAKEDEYEDWLVLLIFNHLFSAAEAFVAANLWDFPEEISFRVLPSDRYGVGVTLAFP